MTEYVEAMTRAAERIGAWRDLAFFSDGFSQVSEQLAQEAGPILPPADDVFAALEQADPEAVRVIILGQDPYPTEGHAHGLAFSVQEDVKPLPRSLKNIFTELQDDLGHAPKHGNLTHWARQGVILLNTALTVRAGDAGSHAKIGWGDLTRQIVERLADRDGLVWILWGRHAHSFRAAIEAGSGKNRLLLESAHPSPLSARRGFFGSKPFSRTNNHLEMHGHIPIDWTL